MEEVIVWKEKNYRKVPAMQLDCGSLCTAVNSGAFCAFFTHMCTEENLFPTCSQEMIVYEEIE